MRHDNREDLTAAMNRAAADPGPWTAYRTISERGATSAGGKPEPPPFPVAGVGLSKRAFPPARTARSYREDEDADAEFEPHLADEDEDESEDGEAELLSVFETALSGLQAVVGVMRRRRAGAEGRRMMSD